MLQQPDLKLFEQLIEKAEREFEEQEDHFIICNTCGHIITSMENMISVNGHHNHTFVNPANITFNIGCFSSADGCTVFGSRTLQDTWFPGYAWAYAACSRCMVHLGWFYRGEDDSFFGLILDRLSETIRTH